MKNMELAQHLIENLQALGVQTFCICPGARNAPFVTLLEANPHIDTLSFFDERSAGFFALGRARRDQRPVVVITTSGTAVSELLSPVIEAWQSHTPLIVLSADRPPRLRGTGAPQTIDQTQIFRGYVEKSLDIHNPESVSLTLSGDKPVHINVCFDEPLIDQSPATLSLSESIVPVEGLSTVSLDGPAWRLSCAAVVVGGLHPEIRPWVETFLSQLKVPILLESLSGLRGSKKISWDQRVSESTIQHLIKQGLVQQILRIGDVPVGRHWRDLESAKQVEVYSVSEKPFKGLSHGLIAVGVITPNTLARIQLEPVDKTLWNQAETKKHSQLENLLAEYPQSEVAMFHALSQRIPLGDRVYLGNSLPVREWDMVSSIHGDIWASRGVNGIDGQLSTALGLKATGQDLWVILGDLTTLYDFSGFWLSTYMREHKHNVNLVVVNNRGGQIFSRLFKQKLFLNSHQLNFEHVAAMWDWGYHQWTQIPAQLPPSGLNLIELCPDSQQTAHFWQAWDGQ
jgi:2-succinyl-5-enolpyruvyl-6-hydroxy-3-cyclohexene-1-carboxylate synthase